MPKIAQYDAPNLGLSPSDRGVQGNLNAARRISKTYDEGAAALDRQAAGVRRIGSETEKLGRETAAEGAAFAQDIGQGLKMVGQAGDNIQTHQQLSTGSVEKEKTIAALAQTWEGAVKDAVKDPNDTSVGPRFIEQALEPALEKFTQGFTTERSQAWAERQAAAIRSHFYNKTAADMSTLAGEAVKKNINDSVTIATNTAMTDPSSVPFLLKSTAESLHAQIDSSPNVTGKAALHLELSDQAAKKIVQAGAYGSISKATDPEAAAKLWGERYPQYISGMELKQFEGFAKTQRSAAMADYERGRKLVKEQAEDRSDAKEGVYLQKLHSDNPQDQAQVSARAIANDMDLTRPARERMIGVVNRELKPETDAKISNGNYVGILGDIRAGKISDVDPIYKARVDGKLNRADFNQALKDFSEYKSPQGEPLAKDREEFFKRYAPAIDPSMGDPQSMQFGHHTALGLQKMYEAEKGARLAEEDARKKGLDPHSVYDPSSPNFFGRSENIMKYRASLQDAQRYQGEISFTPPPTWEYSASRKQYRDPSTKKIYGPDGKEAQ